MIGLKICECCGSWIDKEDFPKHPYSNNGWRNRKFCNDDCRKKHNKRQFKYQLKKTYHDQQLLELNKLIKGGIKIVQNEQDSENADIETDDVNYEFELLHGTDKFKKKYNRHRDKKKHILIVGIHPKLREMFDEVYCYSIDKF
ncbi:unnamed protein product [marine sediment metagenome]|uniref:Uncharacterized protein n=1 Tax=marine sediment metagenome TaxID=412755 RepID=X0RMK7_9ZZZZ